MTRNTLLAVGLGGVVATTIGIATAQPSIADSFIRTINYTTSPAPILVSANTASEIEIDVDKDDGEVEIEVKRPKEHKGFFRSIVGMPMRVVKAPFTFFRKSDEVSFVPTSTTLSVAPSTFTTRTVNSAVVVDDTRVMTSPVVVEKAACTHARVLTAPVVVEKTLESPAVIRSTTGGVFGVEQRVMRRPLLHKIVERPALIEVNKVVERPVVIQRVISQPTVIEKFVEKPAIVDCVISQPAVIAHPTVIRKSVTSPVIILDDDRFLYDFSTHRKLKIDLDD